MNNDVSENFLLYKTTQEIWEAANHILIMKTQLNPSRFDGMLDDLRQREFTVTQYFNLLTRYWQQLDMFESNDWSCPTDAAR